MSKKLITKYIIIAHRTIMIATILFYHTRRNLGSVDEINLKKKKKKKTKWKTKKWIVNYLFSRTSKKYVMAGLECTRKRYPWMIIESSVWKQPLSLYDRETNNGR